MLLTALTTMSLGTLLGYALLGFGVLATALSAQRHLLLYAGGGMLYWLLVEGMQHILTAYTSVTSWHGYVAALAISWVPLFMWVIYRAFRPSTASQPTLSLRAERAQQACYVEHTPVYKSYQPRLR